MTRKKRGPLYMPPAATYVSLEKKDPDGPVFQIRNLCAEIDEYRAGGPGTGKSFLNQLQTLAKIVNGTDRFCRSRKPLGTFGTRMLSRYTDPEKRSYPRKRL